MLRDHMRLSFSNKKLVWQSTRYNRSYQVGKCSNKALKQFPFQGHAYFFGLGIIKELIDEQQENVQKAFIQFPCSYAMRPKFEKCIIEESVREYLRLMLVFVWNSVLKEGFNCYLFEVFR